MEEINDLIKRIESEINKTPTGDLRNILTDANIVLHSYVHISNKLNKIQDMLDKIRPNF